MNKRFIGPWGLIGAIIISGLAYQSYAKSKELEEGKVGRYQMLSGGYETVGTKVQSRQSVFRVDSQTGKAWIYRHEFKDGKYLSYWEEIYD